MASGNPIVLDVSNLTKTYRSAGEQNVIVKHVHVYPGGQAVVGNVKTTGKDQLERAHVRDRVAQEGAFGANRVYAGGCTALIMRTHWPRH